MSFVNSIKDVSLGKVLKEIREEYGYTQKEAAEDVCSLRNYKRIENEELIPTAYTLNLLSKKFNFAFDALICMINSGGDELDVWKRDISAAIEKKSVESMKRLADIGVAKFQSRSVLMTSLYVEGLLLYAEKASQKDIMTTFEKGLRLENPLFSIDNIEIKSNEGLSLLNAYALSLVMSDKLDLAKRVYEYLINRFKTIIHNGGFFYESTSYVSTLYPKSLGGYLDILIKEEKYEQALEEIEYAMNTLTDRYDLKHARLILWEKVKALYYTGRYEEARQAYTQMTSLCDILGQEEYKKRKETVVKKSFPQLL